MLTFSFTALLNISFLFCLYLKPLQFIDSIMILSILVCIHTFSGRLLDVYVSQYADLYMPLFWHSLKIHIGVRNSM